MYTVTNRLTLKPEYAQEITSNLIEHTQALKSMKGFIAFYLIEPEDESQPHRVMSVWESPEDFKAWTQSEAFKRSHANRELMMKSLVGRPVLEKGTVLHSVV